MAIFGQIPKEELGTKYTHYGWFAGCPVYLADIGSASATMVERNWIPGWWLSFVTDAFGCCIYVRSFLDPDYEPMFPIAISGEIK